MKNLDENPPEGIKVVINDDDFSTIFADIDGPGQWRDANIKLLNLSIIYPFSFWVSLNYLFLMYSPKCKFLYVAAGTPYESGVFRMKLLLSHDFPQSPPKGEGVCYLLQITS